MKWRRVVKKYSGSLYAWFETGTEGFVWCLKSDTIDSALLYDDLVVIGNGDHLVVWDDGGGVVFDGIIEEDFEAGWQPYPRQFRSISRFLARHWGRVPGFIKRRCTQFMNGQPVALGLWIHWTQRGWSPDKWASLFLLVDNKKIHAELTREKTPTMPQYDI